MKELPMELKQRMEEACTDVKWAEKIRGTTTWEAYENLLAEKGIEPPAELKEAFVAGRINNTGRLEDDELERVSGGWTNVFSCPKDYSYILCELTRCPHRIRVDNVPDTNHYDLRCDLNYWTINRSYSQDMRGSDQT